MTDNDIIKALECCSANDIWCGDCPYENLCTDTDITKLALDLINRQKAEIDDLKRDTIPKLRSSLERANRYGLQVDEENKMLKAEIARLQENIAPPYLLINCDDKSAEELRETLKTQKPVVDNLVEEMVGEE